MSLLELIIFLYWEFLSSSIPYLWYTLLTNITNVLYFDVLGSHYQACFVCYVLTNVFLTIHRLLYTIVPLQASKILSVSILKVSIIYIYNFRFIFQYITIFLVQSMIGAVIIYYFAYMAFALSPLAAIYFCPLTIWRERAKEFPYSNDKQCFKLYNRNNKYDAIFDNVYHLIS
uniref:G_PROTEIN_RECEP_F1_2 domain-containing protein n=1 Tax=Heterorhabditis bacteriophora TaxID=37862 RepID=A0A1I7WQ82_HETBA